MKIKALWKKGHAFESWQEENHIKIDGDRISGVSPKSLLLSGLAGCSGIDVVDILEKMRIEFSDFSIDVETQQTEEHPKVFKEIIITYKIKTDPSNEDKVRKAVELSLDKYCGVSAMLRKNSPIEFKIVIKQ
ncbi:MAG: OsmC family protein [Bacteroidetes bacterium]|nr:OsmC family protein [Bacteroidota bacterium]MBS1607364.1 OsmC family protein [Bacteroidota bacterium]